MTPTQRKKIVVAQSTREGAPQHEVEANRTPVSQQACTSILVDWITEMVVSERLSIIQSR